VPARSRPDAPPNEVGRQASTTGPKGPSRTGNRVGLPPLRPNSPRGLNRRRGGLCPTRPTSSRVETQRGEIIMAREAGRTFPRSAGRISPREWPREESNLRARIRSPSLYPLSYGAVSRSVAALIARSSQRDEGYPNSRRGGGLCPAPPRPRSPSARIRRKSCAEGATFVGRVADGTRTHDHLDHNQGLYQLSYSHRARPRIAAPAATFRSQRQS
jgi:hypothetical protein